MSLNPLENGVMISSSFPGLDLFDFTNQGTVKWQMEFSAVVPFLFEHSVFSASVKSQYHTARIIVQTPLLIDTSFD